MSDKPFFIAGCCSIEADGQVNVDTAVFLAELGLKLGVNILFKSSWKKANRTSGSGYRGVSIEQAQSVFEQIRAVSGLPVTTDVHEPREVYALRHYVDCLQVPALLSRQTDLIEACADKYPNCMTIKKGQFMAPWDASQAVQKAKDKNPDIRVAVIERGTTFGYNNNVVDYRAFKIMSDAMPDVPIVFDCSHTVQLPSAHGNASGGEREHVAPLALAAACTGYCDGYYIECHPDVDAALCDGPIMTRLSDMPKLMSDIIGAHQYGKNASGNASKVFFD